jgi:hypothetical protein
MEAPASDDVSFDGAPDLDRAVLLEQHADGCWKLTQDLADWAEVDLGLLETLVEKLGGGPDAERLLATLLVLHTMQSRPGGIPDRWVGALEKARSWSKKAASGLPVPEGHASWMEWIAQFA